MIEVSIKHGGKAQNIYLDTSKPPFIFKQAIYEVTGVPVDRMKVMSKGVVIKVRFLPTSLYDLISMDRKTLLGPNSL